MRGDIFKQEFLKINHDEGVQITLGSDAHFQRMWGRILTEL
jgi:histidinol phosphatase-like PHP family hydrolase